MESVSKTTQFKKRRDKLQTIYSRCLLTRKIVLPITFIGKSLDDVIENYIKDGTIEHGDIFYDKDGIKF